jgi:ribosomal protein S18 acetylase RimI-like enzyme
MTITLRRATREDVPAMVAMLADDALGGPRETLSDPLPASYYVGFDAVQANASLMLMVAQDDRGDVVGCFQLCFLPGISSRGATRALIEDVRVASRCRGQGIGEIMLRWAIAEAKARGCVVFELLTHHTRVDAQRFYERLGFSRSHLGMTLRF